MMKDFYALSIQNLDLYHIVSLFFIYSILGWIVESIYMSICEHKLTNRGFIKGPICPIYGVAATVIYFLLLPLSGNYVAIYFVGLIVATAFEYMVALIMQYIFDEVWWDYNNKPFNYKGIICLESSIAWGFYCVFLFAFLQKSAIAFVDFYTDKIGLKAGELIVSLLIIYYIFSFMHTAINHSRKKNAEVQFEQCVQGNAEAAEDTQYNGYFARVKKFIRK